MDDPTREPDWYVAHFERAAGRFAEGLKDINLDAAVPACGDWTVGDLAKHLGGVHQWARFCVQNQRPPTRDDPRPSPFDPDRAADWYRETAEHLTEALGAIDPDGPTWHPFPTDQVARLWPRRQAQEVTVHLWDLQRATSSPDPIDPELAADGIDEFFSVVIPRLMAREGITPPRSSFHVHCTDTEGEWLATGADGEYQVVRAHQKGDAALRGPAELVLLALWRRDHGRDGELSPVGDEQGLADWLAVGGM